MQFYFHCNVNHLPQLPPHVCKLSNWITSLFHMLSLQKPKWNERLSIDSPFRRFRQRIEISPIPIFGKNIKVDKSFALFNIETLLCEYCYTILFNNSVKMSSFQRKFKNLNCKRERVIMPACPKKVESSHCSLNLEIALVLWNTASEVKMEARSEISMKSCIK